MKTMQNFAAQQLSKKQMNEVKGGDNKTVTVYCKVRDNNGVIIDSVKGEGATFLEAWVNAADKVYGWTVTDCKE